MSLILTRLQNMRAKSPLDKKEIRMSRYGALDMYMRQGDSPTGILSAELKAAAGMSIGSTLEVPAIDDNTTLTIGSTRDVVIADAENTSRMIVIPFTTYAHGFTIVPSLFHNNELGEQADFETKMKLTDRLFATAINASCLAHLETNKSKVFADTLLYTELADTIVASFAQRTDILGDLNVMMAANDFFGEIHVVANAGFEALVRDLAESNLYNSVNKRMEYADKVWNWDNALLKGQGKYGSAFCVEEDSLGILFRHEREALLNTKMQDGTEWGVDALPITGIPVSTYFYESKGDYNAINGAASADMTRVRKDHYGFAIDVGLNAAFISDTSNRPSPIAKININLAATDTDSTAPTVAFTSSSGLTNAVITFSEPVCTDAAGTLATGDIKALFDVTVATPGASITTATISADGTVVTMVIVSTNLAAGDLISIATGKLWDGAGNVLAADDIIDVNAGASAWEAAP
jgi:hypothetical protein